MTEQTWNFQEISHSSHGVQGSVAATQGYLEDGQEALKMLAGIWGGASSSAYQAVQTKWNTASDELNAALHDLAIKVGDAGDSMLGTETGIEATFPV